MKRSLYRRMIMEQAVDSLGHFFVSWITAVLPLKLYEKHPRIERKNHPLFPGAVPKVHRRQETGLLSSIRRRHKPLLSRQKPAIQAKDCKRICPQHKWRPPPAQPVFTASTMCDGHQHICRKGRITPVAIQSDKTSDGDPVREMSDGRQYHTR